VKKAVKESKKHYASRNKFAAHTAVQDFQFFIHIYCFCAYLYSSIRLLGEKPKRRVHALRPKISPNSTKARAHSLYFVCLHTSRSRR